MLNAEPDLLVVGAAEDGQEALLLANEHRPDVLLLDVSMPGTDGIEVARILRAGMPHTQVIILTLHEDDCLITEAQEAGAWGYVRKRAAAAELIDAIHGAAAGRSYRWPAKCLNPAAEPPPARDLAPLGQAESEMLRLVVQGSSNAQIGAALGLGVSQVEVRRARLLQHLGLTNRVQLVRYAQEHGLV